MPNSTDPLVQSGTISVVSGGIPPIAPSNTCEPYLRKQVRDMLWPVIVCKKGSRDFGLEQRTLVRVSDRPEVGGWLRRLKPKTGGIGQRQFGEAQYYVLDDVKGLCLLKNDEVKESIKFSKIVSVTAHIDEFAKPKVFYFRVVSVSKGDQKVWDLSPADTSDRQLVLSWTCALQVRSNTYDVVLDLDYEKALKVALWCQSLYRGFRGRLRAERKRLKREASTKRDGTFGIQRMVSGFLGASNVTKPLEDDDESSDDRDDDEVSLTEAVHSRESSPVKIDRKLPPLKHEIPRSMSQMPSNSSFSKENIQTYTTSSGVVSYALSSIRRSLMPSIPPVTSPAGQSSSQISDEGQSTATQEANETKKVKFPANDKNLMVVATTNTGSPNLSKKLNRIQLEDEIWENERYNPMAVKNAQVYRGWSQAALLPGERGGFSDRLGTVSWDSIEDVGVPPGWHITKEWALDVQSSKCNSEGWQYAQTFAALDSNLASGRVNSSASARWLVRRRRWYRVREPDEMERTSTASHDPRSSPRHSTEIHFCDENLIYYGWVGMRGITTGRWTNSFTFLPRKRHKEHLGIAFCYFKKSAKVFNEDMSFRYEFSLTRNKHVRVKFLDNECVVSDEVATRDQPGLFSLHLSGEAEPRLLNAHSAAARVKWVEALTQAIRSSPGPCYEAIANRRSMRKGAAWELFRASGAVKDLVGGSVRGMKQGFEKITRSGTNQYDLQRGESDPDMTQIDTLRQEFRRSDAPWTASTTTPTHSLITSAPRKFSTDSLTSVEQGLPPTGSKRNPSSPSHSTTTERPSFFSSKKESPRLPPMIMSDAEREATSGADEEQLPVMTISTKKNPLSLLKKLTKSSSSKRVEERIREDPGSGGEISPPLHPLVPRIGEVNGIGSQPSSPTTETAAQSTEVLSSTFEMPPPYENIMFDGYFDMPVDEWDKFFMREEEFTRDLLAFEKMFDVELDPWTNGISVGSEHRRRYKMPRVGVVPPGPSLHLLTRTQSCPGKGFVIEQTCSTPEMPWGQHFATDFLNVFAAEGPNRCRVVISQKMSFTKPLMTQGFIKSGTKREITAYYKNVWTQFVRKWLAEKRPHLCKGGGVAGSSNVIDANAKSKDEENLQSVVSAQSVAPSNNTVNDGSEMMMMDKRMMIGFVTLVGLLLLALVVHSILMAQRMSKLEALLMEFVSNSRQTAADS